MGLAYGVEGRVPLLDDGVIRAAFAIPPGQRVGSTGLKGSLRRAVADVLPQPVLERRWKLGFHAPVAIYVAALDEALRPGHRITCEVLGDGPKWNALGASARWSWGALGSYLGWVRAQKGRAGRLDGRRPVRSESAACGLSHGQPKRGVRQQRRRRAERRQVPRTRRRERETPRPTARVAGSPRSRPAALRLK